MSLCSDDEDLTTLVQCWSRMSHGCDKLHLRAMAKNDATVHATIHARATLNTLERFPKASIRRMRTATEILDRPMAMIHSRLLV